jgi:hypothetical protein
MPTLNLGYICFGELNVMSTYDYMRNLEFRSCNLLLNPYTSYFFLYVSLFQLEKVTLNKTVDYSGPYKSSPFFSFETVLGTMN